MNNKPLPGEHTSSQRYRNSPNLVLYHSPRKLNFLGEWYNKKYDALGSWDFEKTQGIEDIARGPHSSIAHRACGA
jgi:hypothetical protein